MHGKHLKMHNRMTASVVLLGVHSHFNHTLPPLPPGHQTFPRSTFRRLETDTQSLRSLMSHSSEGTIDSASRSSSSSGVPADPDWDSPGGRYSLSGPLFSKCESMECNLTERQRCYVYFIIHHSSLS